MGKLDDLVTDHIDNPLLQPERMELILASLLGRTEQTARRRDLIRALAQRIDLHDKGTRIIGNKTYLLHPLAHQRKHNAASGGPF